ncbi:MAG TPA: hypothetical protein VHP14_13090, partial [Anaerolineales bacterium]|nr:hypothetical protein [Anaerolineales bacterium]
TIDRLGERNKVDYESLAYSRPYFERMIRQEMNSQPESDSPPWRFSVISCRRRSIGWGNATRSIMNRWRTPVRTSSA